jgi:hypothetical protein
MDTEPPLSSAVRIAMQQPGLPSKEEQPMQPP